MAELTEKIAAVMADTQARGLACCVINAQGETLYEHYFGYRDAEQGTRIDENTLFGLASVTKSFTSLAIMQLAEAGKLELDDPIAKYLPDFENLCQPRAVTIRHLLSHAGGFFPQPRITVPELCQSLQIFDTPEHDLATDPLFAQEAERLIASRLDRQDQLIGLPGEYMSYCNDGFGLLSEIIRLVGDCPSYADYLDRHLLQPLGMTRSWVSFGRSSRDANVATLYTLEKGHWRADLDFENDAFVLNGGGALKSTLHDLKHYLAMYLNEGSFDGRELIAPYYVREMIKPRQYYKPGAYYGYGLASRFIGDLPIVQHGGSLPGVSSNIAFSPEAGLAAIVLCNTCDVPVGYISDLLWEDQLGLELAPLRSKHQRRDWTPEFKQEIAGHYPSGEGDTLELKLTDGEIQLTVNGQVKDLLPIYPREGVVIGKYGDTYLQFIADQQRGVYAARYGSRIFPKASNQ